MLDGFTSTTQVLSAVGNGTPIAVNARCLAQNMPGVLCIVSGTLTYSVEVTGDDITAPGYNAATGNWVALNPQVSGATASIVTTLGAVVTAVRPVVTAHTSGSLTFQMVQVART